MRDTVVVTGGSGFVASHLVQQLLRRGYRVRATVRSLADAAKVGPLRRLADGCPGELELVEANLLSPGAFDAAVEGYRVVFHVASPFLMPERIRDGRTQILEPAVQGTRNILASITRALGVSYRPVEETVLDHYESWRAQRRASGRAQRHRTPPATGRHVAAPARPA